MSTPRCRFVFSAVLAVLAAFHPTASPADEPFLTNPGFEDGLTGWEFTPEDAAQGMSKALPDAAHTGKMGLHVIQTRTVKTGGSSLGSRPFAVQPGDTFEVTFWARCQEESGVGVFLQFFDAHKQLVKPAKAAFLAVPSTTRDWVQYRFKGTAPEGAVTANVWVHGWSNAKCNADFDDFTVTKAVPEKTEPRVSAERVRAVAAMLDATPRGPGQPITDRAAWERIAAQPGLRAAAVASAERLLPGLLGPLTDDQSKAAKPGVGTEERRFGLVVLTLAECLENRGRFLPVIEKDIRALCSERTWVGAMHDQKLANFNGTVIEIDLISAMTVWNLSTADWVLGDRLSPETRRLIRAESDRRVFAPFLAEARGQEKQEWWSTSPFNWNAVVHSGIVGAATALIDAPARRAEIIAYAEQNVRTYLTGFKADGSTPEGLGYWNYGFGHYTLLAETLLAATHGQINLYADDRARLVAQFPRKLMVLPKVYPAFADCLITDRPALWALNILDGRYNFGWGIPAASHWISPQYSASLYAVIINAFFEPPIWPAKRGRAYDPGAYLRDWMPEGQLYIGRPAVGHAGLALALKGGVNNEPHGHLDVGTYLVASGGEALLLDPGATVYNAQTFSAQRFDNPILNSYGHAVPVVAGQGQKPGAQYRGTVAATSFTDALDSVTLDLTKAYAVPALKALTRRFDYDRGDRGTVTITDSAEFASPQTFGTALVTFGTVREARPGVLLVSQRHETLQVVIDAGGAPFAVKDEVLPEELKQVPYKARRVGIDLTTPAATARITVRITPAAAAVLDPSLVSAAELDRLRPAYAQAVTAQGTEFVRQSGGAVVPTFVLGAGGGAARLWKGAGHALTWKLHIPAAGTYGVQVRHCGEGEGDTVCAWQVDGAAAGEFALPPTGGWSTEGDDWVVSWLARDGRPATCRLTSGDHEITLVNRNGQNTTIDWVRLVPVQP